VKGHTFASEFTMMESISERTASSMGVVGVGSDMVMDQVVNERTIKSFMRNV